MKSFSVKNKVRRRELFIELKKQRNKEELMLKKARNAAEKQDPSLKEKRIAENIPRTLDNTREFDETMVDNDSEVEQDEKTDEMASYFEGHEPKTLITTNRNAPKKVFTFLKELENVFPKSKAIPRKVHDLKKLIELAKEKEFTNIIVIHQNKGTPNALTMIHLPEGPTAYFKLTTTKEGKKLYNHANPTEHFPEIILNNFNTRLGHTIGRLLATLFPQKPEFQGRQVVTFHNQRDFIFFRRHRYEIADVDQAHLQEIGPRFTLKLRAIQKGTFDTKFGEYEWIYKPELQTSRRRFFL